VTQWFFILADSELELIPKEIVNERSILNNARARGKAPEKLLLDASHHHPAFARLPDSERRGRPDIVHFFLMLCIDSDLSLEGKLHAFVHTRNNDVIAVKPETRLPPHYPRFVGLIESLYEQRVVPSRENALLELRNEVPLEVLVKALKPDEVLVLTPAELQTPLLEIFAPLKDVERVVVIIGGFSKGDFRSDLSKFKHTRVSLGPRLQKVWTVTYKLFSAIHYAGKAPEAKVKDAGIAPDAKDSSKAQEPKVKATKPSKPRRAPKKKEE
jgi:rRNA small subunit pseudouridine methyltransferase Nep1